MSGYVRWLASGHRERAEELAGDRDALAEGAQGMLAEATQAQVAQRMEWGLGDGGPGLVT